MDELIDAPSVETFGNHEGDSFSVEDADADLELATVEAAGTDADGFERFTLVFRGEAGLDPGIHRLSADGLDAFDVGLSPTLRLEPGTADGPDSAPVEYEAVFARHDPDASAGASADGDDDTGTGAVGLSVNPLMGGVDLFAGTFAPQGFMRCNGQLLPVNQQSALFSLLGTKYGGDGQQSFALPDLRGRAPVGTGTGQGLSAKRLGERGGRETVALRSDQLAPHRHGTALELPVTSRTGDATSPDGNALAALPRGAEQPIYTTGSTDGSMTVGGEIEPTGDGQPHDNRSPYLALTYVICVAGAYPSRN